MEWSTPVFLTMTVVWIIFLLGVVWIVGLVWSLKEIMRRKDLNDGQRIGWVLIVIFLPVLGVIIYSAVARPERKKSGRRRR